MADNIETIYEELEKLSGAPGNEIQAFVNSKLLNRPDRDDCLPFLRATFAANPVEGTAGFVGQVIEYMEAGQEAIPVLMDIFRAGQTKQFDDYGQLEGYSDFSGRPINYICTKIENGCDMLEAQLSKPEFNEAIARAHYYNHRDRKILAPALARTRTALAVKRFTNDFYQGCRPPEETELLVSSLASFGADHLPLLISKLGNTIPHDPADRTCYRRNLIDVLGRCGDHTCAEVIQKIADSDGSVTEEARKALSAIAARNPGVTVPEDLGPKPVKIRQIERTGDAYVDRCFQCDWEEVDEPRFWNSQPELRAITDLANDRRDDEALMHLDEVWSKYPDHHFVYGWKAIILARKGKHDESIALLKEGLSKVRAKFQICIQIAKIEYEAGNMTEAIVWWIRSAIAQISIGRPTADSPFLYLAYVAQALGDTHSRDKLFEVVDRLSRWGRLNEETIHRIANWTHQGPKVSMAAAIAVLRDEFLIGGQHQRLQGAARKGVAFETASPHTSGPAASTRQARPWWRFWR